MGKQHETSQKEVQIGKKAVLTLMEPYFNTKRCLCADNFLSSIPLCKLLWDYGIDYLGTLRANEIEIPEVILKNKKRSPESTLFEFQIEIRTKKG